MKPMENLMALFKEKLVELEELFGIVASQNSDNAPIMIAVSQNNSLVVRIGMDFWACRLSSEEECNFLQELLESGGKMDGNNIKKWGINPSNDKSIRNFLSSINRKLAVKKMPVRLHFIAWTISIELTPL